MTIINFFKKIDKTFNKQGLVLLIFILFLGFVFRIVNFSQNYYYGIDEELMNLIQKQIALAQHFPMVGSFSAIGSFLLPYFYYIGALILKVSNLSPIGQGYFAAILGVISSFFIFRLGTKLINQKIGLLSAFFYSTSFLMVLFDRRFWHISISPLLTILTILFLHSIKKGNLKFVYLLMLTLLAGWSTDYVNLILFLFVIVMWFLWKLPILKKEVMISIVLFLVLNTPLLIFEIRHDFYSSNILLNYFNDKNVTVEQEKRSHLLNRTREDQAIFSIIQPFISFSRSIYMVTDKNITKQHSYCQQYVDDRNKDQGWMLPMLTLLLTAWFFYLGIKNKINQDGFKLLSIFFGVYIIGLLIYGYLFSSDIFEHYLANLFPVWFLILGVVVSTIKSRILLAGIILGFLIINSYSILTAYNPLGWKYKSEIATFVATTLKGDKFSLESIGSCHNWDGFYYSFVSSGVIPVKSMYDPTYSWLYDYTPDIKHPDKVVMLFAKPTFYDQKIEQAKEKYSPFILEKAQFGDIEVWILDNKKRMFEN
jgi:hypothetical protein